MSGDAFGDALRDVIGGRSLDAQRAETVISQLLDGEISPPRAAALLTALAAKGETVEEIVGAALAMRKRSLRVEHDRGTVLDVCGTGGDGARTINISTAVAFVVAACGVAVAKHGNRSSSSLCGSADVLEMLGVDIDRSPSEARESLDRGEVAFLFAQRYHPALKQLAPLRRDLGFRTIFNLLGPLTNPARATHQLIGVAHPQFLESIAAAAQAMGVRAGAVLHAVNGLDEVAGDAMTTVVRFNAGAVLHTTIDPSHFAIHASLEDLRGGSVEENAAALVAILDGERSPRADVVALNAALALDIAGVVDTLAAGLQRAREALADGSARAQLARLQRAGEVAAP